MRYVLRDADTEIVETKTLKWEEDHIDTEEMVLKINGQQSSLFWKIKGSWESVCVVNSDTSTSIPSTHITECCHTNEVAGKGQ